MTTLFRTLLSFIILSIGTLSLQAMPVAAEGVAVAEIIVEGETPPEQYAAKELVTWIERISGAALATETVAGEQPTKIYLGTPETSPTIRKITEQYYAEDLEKLKNNDGFAIRNREGDLYIFATQPKGVLNGIYRLLDKNSDIIFVRAMESEEGLGTIYSQNPNLTLTVTDLLEVPSFQRRSLQGDPVWNARLMTRNHVFDPGNAKTRALLDQTGTEYITHKHSVQPQDFKDKPEFFALVNGKRSSSPYYSQLCYSNPELAELYLQRLKETATQLSNVSIFDSQHADNWRVCECPQCTRPYTLADGTVIQPDDPAFRSTVFFDFTNRAALLLKQEFPGQNKRMHALAYVWSNPPPKLQLADNLTVFFAAFVRDQRYPIFHPINAKWHQSIEQWMQQHKNIEFFEYYFSTKLPWFYYPISDVIAEDLRYYANHGITGGMYQDGPDITSSDSDKPLEGGILTGAEFYDLSAIEFWVTSRLYWDPHHDVEALRDEFCRRAYREAAAPMRQFFATIHNIWYHDPAPTYYSDDPIMAVRRYIVETNQQEPLRQLLVKAESQAQHPGSRALIQRARRLFEKWLVEENKLGVRLTMDVPYVSQSMSDQLDFTAEAWKRATVIAGFSPVGKPNEPAQSQTRVLLLHDRTHLYLAFECKDTPEKIALIRAMETGNTLDDWNAMGHHYIEMFFDGDQKTAGSYYQLAFGINGHRYDGQGYSNQWSKPWSVKTVVHDDAWRAVVTLPLDSIGVDINVDRLIGSMLLRSDNTSWQGGNVHQPAGFQTLRLLVD